MDNGGEVTCGPHDAFDLLHEEEEGRKANN